MAAAPAAAAAAVSSATVTPRILTSRRIRGSSRRAAYSSHRKYAFAPGGTVPGGNTGASAFAGGGGGGGGGAGPSPSRPLCSAWASARPRRVCPSSTSMSMSTLSEASPSRRSRSCSLVWPRYRAASAVSRASKASAAARPAAKADMSKDWWRMWERESEGEKGGWHVGQA